MICPGRVVLDLMRVTQMGEALRLYTLGEISQSLLGKTFETLDTATTEALLQQAAAADDADGTGGRIAVARVLRAFLSTADLALEVLAKRNAVAELVEVSRVTGQMLRDVYIRGQMSRVSSLLQQHCHASGIVIPADTSDLLDKQQLNRSAYLVDPSPPSVDSPDGVGTAGLRRSFVAVLDFRSLYPSIIIEHNVCYSTLLLGAGQSVGSEGDIFETPIGARFVGASTRKGVLPSLLIDLLEARGAAQRDLRERTDLREPERRVLDARQRAFKASDSGSGGRRSWLMPDRPYLSHHHTSPFSSRTIHYTPHHHHSSPPTLSTVLPGPASTPYTAASWATPSSRWVANTSRGLSPWWGTSSRSSRYVYVYVYVGTQMSPVLNATE